MKKYAALAALIFCIATSSVFGWTLETEQEGIKVYTDEIEGSSFKAFRGETTVSASLKQVAAQLMDVEAMRDWLHDCAESELVTRLEGQEFIIYQKTSAPWPVDDRDYLLHSKISQHPESHVVEMNFTALTEGGATDDECVRVTQLTGFWRLTPQGPGQVYIEYETHADPAGNLPAWLANSFVVEQPLNTLKNLKQRIGGPSSVEDADLAFIEEPKL